MRGKSGSKYTCTHVQAEKIGLKFLWLDSPACGLKGLRVKSALSRSSSSSSLVVESIASSHYTFQGFEVV